MQTFHTTQGATRDRAGLALATICANIFVISVDTTIVNVALPTFARTLHATNSRRNGSRMPTP
jgi:hypothetical protein